MDTNPKLRQYAQLLRQVGDLYTFDKEILGYSAMAEQPHRLMCDSVVNGGKRQLHLWPRGHFKSSCITIGYVIRQIALNPNVRILIGNVTLSNAKSFLREIKGHLETNERLRGIIGDHVNKDSKWTETELISKQRTKNLKEPTIQVAGIGQSLVGQHYDIIILDDIVDKDTVNTPEQIEKTKAWYRFALSLLEPDGQLVLIGTRYHYNDIYGWLIETAAEKFNPQVHGVYGADGKPIFPSRFTEEIIAELRIDQGSFLFSCNYLNDPVDDENAKFKKSQIKYYEDTLLEGKQLKTFYAIDRGYSLNKTADHTAHVIVSVDLDNNWYIRLALRAKEQEGALIGRVFDNKDYFKPAVVGIEQKAFNDTIKPALEDEMRLRNNFFSVQELIGRTSKIGRIEGLVPRFEAGSIYLKKEMTDLEDELLRFPSAEHDDLADALAYILDIAHPPSTHRPARTVRRYDPVTGRLLS